MTTTIGQAIAAKALEHLGDASPDNSCVSNGMAKWTKEAGADALPTASVSEAKAMALAGWHGWTYHTNLSGVRVGDFVDWDPEVLGSATDRHVSCVVEIDSHGAIKSVGSGGPSGKVAYQPRGGGFNPPDYFRGYFRAPAPAKAPAAPAKAPAAPQPAKAAQGDYVIRAGDDLLSIARAHHTTVAAIMKANPPGSDGATRNFHIVRANYVLAGQKIHLP